MPLYKIKFIQQYCSDKFVYSGVTLCLPLNIQVIPSSFVLTSTVWSTTFISVSEATVLPSSLAKGYDPLYSSPPLASLDEFSRSHGDGLYVMQLVVAATNQNGLYKKHMFCRKNVNKIKMRKIVSPTRF